MLDVFGEVLGQGDPLAAAELHWRSITAAMAGSGPATGQTGMHWLNPLTMPIGRRCQVGLFVQVICLCMSCMWEGKALQAFFAVCCACIVSALPSGGVLTRQTQSGLAPLTACHVSAAAGSAGVSHPSPLRSPTPLSSDNHAAAVAAVMAAADNSGLLASNSLAAAAAAAAAGGSGAFGGNGNAALPPAGLLGGGLSAAGGSRVVVSPFEGPNVGAVMGAAAAAGSGPAAFGLAGVFCVPKCCSVALP